MSTETHTNNHTREVGFTDLRAAIRQDFLTATREGFTLVAERAQSLLDWIDSVDEYSRQHGRVITGVQIVITTEEKQS